jgi:histidinol phosphatase-like PHP family hydrolase
MDPRALAGLDLVLGAFHSALRRQDDQTARYLAAVRNPDIDVLAHPRGRIYNFRAGLCADWAQVFDAAAVADKAVEIDAYVDRQDLNVELLEAARRAGVRISIGSDAHHPRELAMIEFGVAAAVAAGVPPTRIVNLQPVESVLAWRWGRPR